MPTLSCADQIDWKPAADEEMELKNNTVQDSQ
jgi:hypothetical protein